MKKINLNIILVFSFPFIVSISSCQDSPDDKKITIDDGRYHARVTYTHELKKIDTTFYCYVKIKKGYIAELDSENGKIFKLGVYQPSKIDNYNSYASIVSWDGGNYDIILLNDWGEQLGIHFGRRQQIPVK